jgi:hypothetical protein
MSKSKKTDLNKFQKKWKEYLNKWGSKYSPDESIITKHGCICKKKFIPVEGANKGNVIINACITHADGGYGFKENWWCDVSGSECGFEYSKEINGKKIKRQWDYCNLEEPKSAWTTKSGTSKEFKHQSILGLFIFIIIFMILIPLLLIHFKFYNFLHVYMPNFDLLATSISWDNGPGGRNNRLFQSLYNPGAKSVIGFISTTFINFMSLLGVIFLLIKTYIEHSNKRIKKNTNKKFVPDALANTLGTAMIMLLITYLLPNPIITQIQETLRVFLFEKFNLTRESLLLYFILVSTGLLFSTLCIFTEMYLIKMKIFSPIIEKIYSFLSLL